MDRKLFFSITALGISSVITQLLVIREFLNVFSGNELVLGVIIANWLLITGIGAYLGRYRTKKDIVLFQVLVAFLPFVAVLLIRSLRTLFFSMQSMFTVFAASFLLLLPYCLISGMLLTLFCIAFSRKNAIGHVYFLDNIGDILGGLVFSFLLVFILDPFQIISLIMIINLIAAFFLAKKKNLIVILILAALFLSSTDFNRLSTELQYKGQELVYQEDSIYGRLVITRTQDQLNYYQNGMILFSTENTLENEEAVHYAMVQHPDPQDVLLVSGGVSGTLDEILKHVDKVDYVELDPLVIEAARSRIPQNVAVISKDARLYLRQTSKKYDIVIIDLPDPATAQVNRFYTLEFFQELKNRLNDRAVISLSLVSAENYLSDDAVRLNSVLYKTLKQVFADVIIVPSGRNYFLASDEKLSYQISRLMGDKNITAHFVDYLEGMQTRIVSTMDSIDADVGINKDFRPVAYYYYLLYFLSYFRLDYLLFVLAIFLFMAVYLAGLRPVTFSIFATGFTASSLELVILFGLQVIYGYVYHMVGVIITMFMLGLALGSFYANRKKRSVTTFVILEFAIVAYALLLPFILVNLRTLNLGFVASQLIFSLLTLALAIMVGMEFPIAAKLDFTSVKETASKLYTADLIGSAIGALITAAFLVPLLGLINVCIAVAAVNLISAFIILTKK